MLSALFWPKGLGWLSSLKMEIRNLNTGMYIDAIPK